MNSLHPCRPRWPDAPVVLCIALLLCGAARAASLQFYVSPDGRDSWSGRFAKPSLLHQDGPFRTLHRARTAVRVARSIGQEAGEIAVLIREGTYVLTEPFVLGPDDSGRERGPTVYQAFPDERVRIVGSVPVSGWQSCFNGSYRADLSAGDLAHISFSELFYRGRRQDLARTPNADSSHPHSGGFLYARQPPARRGEMVVLGVDPTRVRADRWRFPARMRVHIWTGSGPASEETVPLARQGHGAGLICLAGEPQRPVEAGARFFLENAFEELDAPGEWFYDADTRQLYFRPPDGRNPEGQVTVPVVTHLIDVNGSEGDAPEAATHIRLEGLILAEATDCLVSFGSVDRCELVDSLLMSSGNTAVRIGADARRVRVARCDITGTGAGAVDVRGRAHWGEREQGARNVITDNHIYQTGALNAEAAAVQVGNRMRNETSPGNVITHNLIHDAAGPGIVICGVRTTCDYNRIHHTNLGTSHSAALAFEGTPEHTADSGGVARFNWVHDTGGYAMSEPGLWAFPTQTVGIRVGPDAAAMQITGNCVHGAPDACIHIHGDRGHAVENNLLYGKARALLRISVASPEKRDGTAPGHVLKQNLFVLVGADSVWLDLDAPWAALSASDWNCLWADDGPVRARVVGTEVPLGWNRWQDLGYDMRSAIVDPLLKAPDAGDFSLDARSLALKLGFVPIPFDRIGLTEPDERPAWPVEPEPVRENYLRRPGPGPIERLP